MGVENRREGGGKWGEMVVVFGFGPFGYLCSLLYNNGSGTRGI